MPLDADGAGAGSVLLKLGAEYAANDTITFTFNNAKATNSNWPTSLNSVTPGTGSATTLGATEAVGSTTINMAANTNYVVGDIIVITGDTTEYRLVNVASTTAMQIKPAIVKSAASGVAVTPKNPKTLALGLQTSTDRKSVV